MDRRPLALLVAATVMAVFAMLIVACGGDDSAADAGKLKVVATTQQIGALARAVGGDRVSVSTLIGPGVDPHEYEASPNDIKRLGSAKVVLRHGIGLDNHLDKAIEGSGASKVVTVTSGITLLKGQSESGKGDDDPHVWHDPEAAKVMTDNIASALAGVDPANAESFRQGAAAEKQRLDDADRQIKALVATLPPENRKMVTDHDAFGYFIAHFGLQFVGTVIPGVSTQAEASAKAIATLEDTIRTQKVKAIFAETSLDPRVARQVANDTGVKIVSDLYGDSLGAPGSGADTVEGMLLSNATKIVDALR